MNLLVFLAIIGHKSIQIASVYRQLSNDNMLSTQPIKPTVLPQGVLTFEDFEDNEEYDKILTAEELRKKAYDFISVCLWLLRNSRIRNKKRKISVRRRNDVFH